MPHAGISRRDWLKQAGFAVGAAVIGSNVHAEPRAKRRAIRLAHLTDIHVQPELGAGQGMAACLRHVQSLDDVPDLVLTGGDSIMDSFAATASRTRQQWELWSDVLKSECALPIESCIGNHDVWGWDKKKSETTGSEMRHGKRWAMDALGLAERYRSFEKAGWHFIVLDSTQPAPVEGEYIAQLDTEQFDWLAEDLQRVPNGTPVLILSHIPILAAAAFFDGDNETTGNWVVPGAWMHIDARRIKDLFLKHPKVKLCISGHLHLIDQVVYNDVTYLCNGAVCGGWWKGNNQECDEGYAVIDLFDDGSFDAQYVSFGWQPRA